MIKFDAMANDEYNSCSGMNTLILLKGKFLVVSVLNYNYLCPLMILMFFASPSSFISPFLT